MRRHPQSLFTSLFRSWGHCVGTRPYTVISSSALVAIALIASIFPRLPLTAEIEVQNLWVPKAARAIDDKAKYDLLYNAGNKEFRRNSVYFTTKPPGGNVLTSEVFKEVRRFDLMVNDNLTATEYDKGEDLVATVSYSDVCAKSTTQFGGENSTAPNCLVFGHPLLLFYRVGGIFELDKTDDEILTIVNSARGIDASLYPPSSNRTFNVEGTFGGIERDADGKIIKATAIAMSFLLDDAERGSAKYKSALAWEDQLNVLINSYPCDLSVTSHDRCSDWTSSTPQSGGSASGCYNLPGEAEACAAEATAIWASEVIEITAQTEGAISREGASLISGDVVRINISFAMIIAYCLIVFIRCRPAFSRGLLALTGLVSCGLAIGVAYGFTTLCGLPVNPVVTILPFILLGIGVDDMFVLINAFEKTSIDASPADRMSEAMASAGVSITITSVTDLFAFVLGITSALPALSEFCAFAAVGITADFLLQISFFAGFMTLDARREAARRPDGCPCCSPIQNDIGKSQEESTTGCCCCCYDLCDTIVAPQEGRLRSFLRKFYAPLIPKRWFKIGVMVLVFGWAGFSGWAASRLKQNFEFRWFVNDDSVLQQVFDVQDNYFSNSGAPLSIVLPSSADFNYSSISGQKAMLDLYRKFDTNSYIEEDSTTLWYNLFRDWIWSCGEALELPWAPGVLCARRDCLYQDGVRKVAPYCSQAKQIRTTDGEELFDVNGEAIYGPADPKFVLDESGQVLADGELLELAYIPEEQFFTWLDQFVADSPLGGLVSSDIVWTRNSTVRSAQEVALGVRGSRIRATSIKLSIADEEVASMQDARSVTDTSGIVGSFPYSFQYLFYEQYAVIQREALTNLGLALVAVFVITFLILGDLRSTAMVMLCVLLTDCDILGLMYLWGLTIDSVSVVNLVLAIGLAVDYSAHVAHAFTEATGTRNERAQKAVLEMGTAVIHGAFSTFLAVLVLASSKSYIFRVFFKQFFGICLFGVFHGLVFLPVLMSVAGPPSRVAQPPKGAKDVENGANKQNLSSTNAATVAVEVASAPTTADTVDEDRATAR